MKRFFRILAIPTMLLCIQECYATWSAPINASDGTTDVYGIGIAGNNLGDTVFVWEDNAAPALYASISTDAGTTWGAQSLLGGPSTGANDINPGVAIDSLSSKAIATWSSANSGVSGFIGEVYASTYSGTGWTTQAISGNAGTQNINLQTPATIMNAGGTAAVAWSDTGVNDVFVTYYDGTTWTTPTVISTGISGTLPLLGNVSMAANGGNVVAVWVEVVGSTQSVYSNSSTNGGINWSSATLVYNTHNAYNPTVSINASGEMVATWEVDLGTGVFNIYAATSSNGITWGTPTLLGTSNNGTGGTTFCYPQVSINDSGNIVASQTYWETATGPSFINSASYNGSSWSTALTLGTSGYSTPLVQLNNAGDAVIAGISGSFGAYILQPFVSTNSGSSWSAASSPLISNAVNLEFGLTLNSNRAIAAFSAPNGTSQYAQISYYQFSNSLSAPSSISGARKANRFPFQTDYYNQIVWTASSSSGVTAYYVFRNGTQIGIVSANSPLLYRDHDISRSLTYTYSVTAVNDSGQSSPITITILP